MQFWNEGKIPLSPFPQFESIDTEEYIILFEAKRIPMLFLTQKYVENFSSLLLQYIYSPYRLEIRLRSAGS